MNPRSTDCEADALTTTPIAPVILKYCCLLNRKSVNVLLVIFGMSRQGIEPMFNDCKAEAPTTTPLLGLASLRATVNAQLYSVGKHFMTMSTVFVCSMCCAGRFHSGHKSHTHTNMHICNHQGNSETSNQNCYCLNTR